MNYEMKRFRNSTSATNIFRPLTQHELAYVYYWHLALPIQR